MNIDGPSSVRASCVSCGSRSRFAVTILGRQQIAVHHGACGQLVLLELGAAVFNLCVTWKSLVVLLNTEELVVLDFS